jgi:hypothetical protein
MTYTQIVEVMLCIYEFLILRKGGTSSPAGHVCCACGLSALERGIFGLLKDPESNQDKEAGAGQLAQHNQTQMLLYIETHI